MANVHLSSTRSTMLELSRVHNAFHKARRLKLPYCVVSEAYEIYKQAHVTEFFSEAQENCIMYIEAQKESDDEHQRGANLRC